MPNCRAMHKHKLRARALRVSLVRGPWGLERGASCEVETGARAHSVPRLCGVRPGRVWSSKLIHTPLFSYKRGSGDWGVIFSQNKLYLFAPKIRALNTTHTHTFGGK